ncbi:MAG: hypothetical protein LBP91_01020 [Coriobacteriales bacterium]|jgi:site-specific recombinase XerD|nr:hypothetical protein [Coriobacteriales bacterium]
MLRHSYANVALAGGIDIAIISKMLRRSRDSTTANRYLKPLSSARINAASAYAVLVDPIV